MIYSIYILYNIIYIYNLGCHFAHFLFFSCALPRPQELQPFVTVFSSSLPSSGFGPLVNTSMGWDALTTFSQSFKYLQYDSY